MYRKVQISMKVAIYCRVSTEDQSNEKQIKMCKEYAKRNNHDIYQIYSDTISGAKAIRPAFSRLLADMRLYKFRAVIITKLDRLGRSLKHLIEILDEMQNKKVELISITQNIDTTTATGRMQWQLLGAFSEFERQIISERTKEGLKYARNVGKRGKDKKPRKKRGVLRK